MLYKAVCVMLVPALCGCFQPAYTAGDTEFTNDFAVELFDDDPDVVDLVAQSHGCRKIRKVNHVLFDILLNTEFIEL